MTKTAEPLIFFWHRRDLRLHDNAGLYHALKQGLAVQPVFIFDRDILDELESDDKRVGFIYQSIQKIKDQYAEAGSDLWVFHGRTSDIWKQLSEQYHIKAVYANHDYEPYALRRDEHVTTILAASGAAMHTYKDQCIFEKDEIIKDDGTPYTVFTPYAKRWLSKVTPFFLRSYPSEQYLQNLNKCEVSPLITLREMGFRAYSDLYPPPVFPADIVQRYDQTRDFPALEQGTSHLGIHYRFGTVSVREYARNAAQLSATYYKELIWREFFMMLMYHFPHVVTGSFRPEFDRIAWVNNEEQFRRWCEGRTGFPLVDAGMRELNATGYMHNRVRMVTASFLTKDMLIDWRWGEAYFARKLLDFELASNNGNWQWAAGTGADAAPYFRIFNPELQQRRFDPHMAYCRKWIPELGTSQYPGPIVEHKEAAIRCVQVYRQALKS